MVPGTDPDQSALLLVWVLLFKYRKVMVDLFILAVVQINIKRCRNDGCDTRVHGLKAVGYK